jgi:uncharacterized membrane protein
LSAALVYLWWGILTQGGATDFVTTLHNSINSLTQIASIEARTATDQKIYASGLQGSAEVLNLVAYYSTAALAALGALIATVRYKEAKFEREYRVLMIGSLVLWLFAIAMPGLSYFVSATVVFEFTLVILLPSIPLGALAIVRVPRVASSVLTQTGLKSSRSDKTSSLVRARQNEQVHAILVVLLILMILANTGLSYQLFGQSKAVLLNSQGQQYDTWYIHPEEIAAGTWLYTYNTVNSTTYVDSYSFVRLNVAQELLPANQQGSLHTAPVGQGVTLPAYFFLRYENVVDGTAILSGQTVTSSSQLYTPVANTSLLSGNKIYSNGGSDVYYALGST